MKRILLLTLLALLVSATGTFARNVDLVTLPPREGVQLTIYNNEDLTLVRETRNVTFKKGINRLQFSWANTLIDPTSVFLRPLAQDTQIEVMDTTFPSDRPQVLIWNVQSAFEGQVPVEVTYFTSGISWKADYVMITDPGETTMNIDGFVSVQNHSGEEYEGAEVRLVVGVVNLVEKIAQLAQVTKETSPSVAEPVKMRAQAMRAALDEAECKDQMAAPCGAMAGETEAPKIVKEGLSEYFIFTVGGRQNVKEGWSQRMISFRAEDVPFEVLYRYRAHQYGDRPVRFFLLANDTEHKMGESPLPNGLIQVFRRNQLDGLAYYTTQETKYIPIREKIELNVGTDDQLVYKRMIHDAERRDFLFDDNPPVVVGWDELQTWKEEVRNYRDKPVTIEFRHLLSGDVEFEMEEGPPSLYDFQTVEYKLVFPAHKTLSWNSTGLFHLGRKQKQNSIRLVK